jgi:GAF domain
MRSRAVRITLTLLSFGAIAAAAYLTWSIDTRLSNSRRANSVFETAYNAAVREAYELRSAEQAYVAAGQSETFWAAKVTASIDALRGALDALTSSSRSTAVHAAVEAVAQALEDFERVDRRARGYATTGQKLLAADIIFSDGLKATGRILSTLGDVRNVSIAEADGAVRGARLEGITALGASAGVVAIALLLLTGLPRAGASGMPATDDVARPTLDLDLRRQVSPPAPKSASAVASAAAKRAPETPAGLREADLLGLASICTDLARLTDTGTLPAILERASRALDASGLVLWVVDPDGKELMPVAAHGYPVSMLSRLGSLSVHGENATAAAFRTGLVQTVKGEHGVEGAIAAPLVGSSGCRGVMSAEVRHEGERQPARLAAASIVAAQLATLIGPPAARSQHDRNSAAL